MIDKSSSADLDDSLSETHLILRSSEQKYWHIVLFLNIFSMCYKSVCLEINGVSFWNQGFIYLVVEVIQILSSLRQRGKFPWNFSKYYHFLSSKSLTWQVYCRHKFFVASMLPLQVYNNTLKKRKYKTPVAKIT